MKITDTRKLVKAGELKPGDVFKNCGSHYIVREGKGTEEFPIRCTSLSDGTSNSFAGDASVTKLDAELIIR